MRPALSLAYAFTCRAQHNDKSLPVSASEGRFPERSRC